MEAYAVDGRNPQLSRKSCLQRLQTITQAVVRAQYFFAGLQKRAALCSDREGFFPALDKCDFELFFQGSNLLTYCALRDCI